jgi:1,4-alpha-glucan branching enzyme
MLIKKGKSQVTFVYQPVNGAHKVLLAGSFNNWEPAGCPMTRQKDGWFRKRLTLEPGEYRYKFLVDGQWVEDSQADLLVPNEFGTKDSLVKIG